MISIAHYIDHTLLKPTTTFIEINIICKEALEYGFAAVCVPPPLVGEAVGLVKAPEVGRAPKSAGRRQSDGEERQRSDGEVKIATVIGFPFGYSTLAAKLAEVKQALADGADELDVVINLVALKNGDWSKLEAEMSPLTDRVHADGKIIKVIIESGILTDEEIVRCCTIYSRIGVDFLKTSTGYAEKGATIGAVQLMRRNLPAGIRIKASGGIKNYAFARQLIEAGADRLGCSASVEIVNGEAVAGGY